jgi:glyoxylase-like metal-dependent hydrolase (beta-lactamase superfamily II)
VRAVGLHEDVVVVTSAFWQTNATAVRSGSEAFLIDSPVLPDELELLPGMLEQSAFPVVGLLVTHADWDHLLGRYAYPEAAMACSETTAARLTAEPGAAQRELRKFDEENYVERPAPLSLPGAQALPVPGYCEVGERELELHPADGHTADGMAIWAPWAGVLVCGDYVSPVEIPWLSEGGGNLDAYLATLERLRPLVEQADWIVPGHGSPMPSAQALAVLREDVAYLEGLRERGEAAELPLARRNQAQRGIHALNVAVVSGTGGTS